LQGLGAAGAMMARKAATSIFMKLMGDTLIIKKDKLLRHLIMMSPWQLVQ